MLNKQGKRMCDKDIEDLSPGDYKKTTSKSPTGVDIPTTEFADGTTQYDFGGMGGKVNYDEYGNECS